MKTDNELIAEFHGWKKIPTPKMQGNYWSFPEWGRAHFFHSDSFLYHASWDWLMPVVEKIDKLYSQAFPGNDEFIRRILSKEEPLDGPYMDVIALPIATPIEEVYKAVIKFIKWYNSQDSKPK